MRSNLFNKKRIILLFVIGALLLSAGTWAYSETSEGPQINKETAIQIANDTFKKINPESQVIKLELKKEELGNQLNWVAEYGSDGRIIINAHDGKVKFIYNKKALKDMSASEKSLLSKDVARERVREVTQVLGLFAPPSPPTESKLITKKGGLNVWKFTWQRETNGYKFHDDWVTVFLMADTGNLFGYNNRYFSSDPPSFKIETGILQAVEFAKSVGTEKGFTLQPEYANLMIVNPNYRWVGKFIKVPPAETRLAWVIPFSKPEGRGEIWVDASTGGVLGGIESK